MNQTTTNITQLQDTHSTCHSHGPLDPEKPTYLLDEFQLEILELTQYPDGWDGPDSRAPSPETAINAAVFVQYWKSELGKLEIELEYDGTIALQLYDAEGYTKGGISFIGDSKGFYTVIKGTKRISSSSFNANSIAELKEVVEEIEDALKKNWTND